MILILIAIVVAASLSIYLISVGGNMYNILPEAFGILLLGLSILSLVIYSFTAWDWFAAEYKANIINREYGTNYTQEEIFYASDVIETVRQLNHNRYEINGNLMKESKEN